MKIMTILGTRPEIIRLSRIIPQLDGLCDHVLIHTGQNFDASLSDVFFQQLGVRNPDRYLGIRGETFGEQIGKIITQTERAMADEQPDRVLLLGDTNSALSAIVAKRLGIPVYHMEAGNRCYDDRVPEEVNRRIVDHCHRMRTTQAMCAPVQTAILRGSILGVLPTRSSTCLTKNATPLACTPKKTTRVQVLS